MHNWKIYAWRIFLIVQVILFLTATVKPANAYADPGTGLLFLQVGGSMLAGTMFVLRAKLRKLFRSDNRRKAVENTSRHDGASEAETGPME